ncbi:multi-sensor signal transduction histidine kinase [Chthoniobacter flavus Ellin428]|uniref:histidine kinase n=1 Tax=Chthoniobacter flavus Ellin428 TaxID=497964 RepID=B4D266_9BACT|nr:DAHL domain-containing protein [Chthoniobacter flavus]EDY19306.1 multi-sensor signal transduction histidine kinase [Chthoniobacter flavus Ellin428]TCO90562.1 PAS domain S-box-containing protein [Chthoniobacter flavus]
MKLSPKHVLTGLALLGALVIFYLKTNHIVFAEHKRFDDDIHRLRQVDASLNQDVLKSPFHLIEDYDRFPEEINALQKTTEELGGAIPSFTPPAGRGLIQQKVNELSQLLSQKEELLERFKSQNAVLNNSLRYLPVSGTELIEATAGDDQGRELKAILNEVMRQVLVYSLRTDDESAQEIHVSLSKLDEWRSRHRDDAQGAALASLAGHVKSIVQHKPRVEALMEQLVSIPVDQCLEEMQGVYDEQFARAMRRADLYRVGLYLLCGFLVVGIGYTIFALDAANTHLERRVAGRTSDLSRKNEELRLEIAERQRAEKLLAENEQRLRLILESEPECVKLVDADGILLEMNPAGLRMVEASHFGEVLGQSVYGIVAPDYHPVFRALNEAVFQGESRIAEYEIIGLKGTRRWMQTHACPLRDTAGKIFAQLAVTRDVTESRRVEAELAYERDLLRTLLENSPDQIYFKDRDSRFLKCSNALAGRFQVTHGDDLVGRCDFDYFTDEHARPAFEDEQEIIRTGRAMVGKVEKEIWKDSDGHKVTWVLTTKVPLQDKTGEIIGTFGISKDITAIKEAENKLEAVHKELLHTSRQAGMAEVATSVLHNVGNVLNSVNVSCAVISEKIGKSRIANVTKVAELLIQHADDVPAFFASDPVGQKLPHFLTKLAQRLSTEQAVVLDEVRLLAKNIEHIREIVAMQQSYANVAGVQEALPVQELVEDALHMNGAALARHGVKVIREYAAAPPVSVDKHKVLQILVNLMRNAKHALTDGGREDKQILVSIRRRDDHVAVSISDNGIGIAPENMTRIFAHGFTTKRGGHGFGLHSGVLAAREMGGRLAAHSDGPGRGATFTLELPINPPVTATPLPSKNRH